MAVTMATILLLNVQTLSVPLRPDEEVIINLLSFLFLAGDCFCSQH